MPNFNINTSDSESLNQEPVKKYRGDAKGTDDFDPTKGYIVHDKATGEKIAKWVGPDGIFREKRIK